MENPLAPSDDQHVTSYAVNWQPHSGTVHSGRLEIGEGELSFHNGDAADTIRYDEVLRIENDLRDRIGPRRAVRLIRRDGRAVLIAGQSAAIGELAEITAALYAAISPAAG